MQARAGQTAQPLTLSVAAFPAIDEVIKAAVPQWQQLHPNVTLQITSRQFTDHHTAMTTALSTAVRLPDLMALEVSYVGRFAQGGGLEDLSQAPYGMQGLTHRFVRYAIEQSTHPSGRIVGVPADIGPGTLLYRQDLLQKAHLQREAWVRTWEDYIDGGIRLKAATGSYLLAHAREIKDIVIRTGLNPGEGLYFSRDSKVLVNSPRFVRAFELARKVRQHKLDARVSAWSSEWTEGFRRGTLASQMSGAWLAGHMNNWLAPGTRGLWRASPLPEGANVAYGGTFLAIAKNAPPERKALAWDLIRLLTLDRHMQLRAFKAQDAFPALVETFDDPFFEEPLPFLGGQPGRVMWRDTAKQITSVPVHKQDAFADEVINSELDQVLDHNKSINKALADANRLLQQRAHR